MPPRFPSIFATLMIFTDERLTALKQWLLSLPKPLGLALETLTVASSDASFRRYLRIHTRANTQDNDGNNTASFVVMDAPPSHEDCKPFVAIAQHMRACAVTVPEIIVSDLTNGFLLLTDFGDTTFLSKVAAVAAGEAGPYYTKAITQLVQLQKAVTCDNPQWPLPPYNREVLLRELMLYPDWYITQHKGITLSDKEKATLMAAFELIIANNLAQPKVAVHRDYHSRNLMVLNSKTNIKANNQPANNQLANIELGIIDFQDALHGPITYDLVSLLRDAYIEWHEPEVIDWTISYWEQAKKAELPVSDQFGEFYKDFEWMGLQRHIKVLGIFARLAIRDGKESYISSMPLVSKYCLAAAQRYGALKPLANLMLKIEGAQNTVGYTF
jgi:N-acetylmuramate 1-kinase